MSATRSSPSSSGGSAWPWAAAFVAFVGIAALVLTLQARRGGVDVPPAPPSASDRDGDDRAKRPTDPTPEDAPPAWQAPPERREPKPSRPAVEAEEDVRSDGPALVRGRLLDSKGAGVQGIDIDLWDAEGDFEDSVETDADGRFEFESDDTLDAGFTVCVDASGGEEVDGEPAGFTQYTHGEDLVPGDDPVECTLRFLPAARVAGFVLEAETRTPIAGADIEIVSGLAAWDGDYVDTRSSDDGSYEIAITDFPSDTVFVSVVDDDDRVLFLGPRSFAPGKTHSLDLLLRSPWTISGMVRDRATGDAIEDAEVSWLAHASMHDQEGDTEATDSYGEWELEEVPPSRRGVVLAVRAKGYSPTVVRVEDPDPAVIIDLDTMTRAAGMVTAGDNRTPIAAARVTFILRHPDGNRTDVTESDLTNGVGRFDLALDEVPVQACDVVVEINGQVVLEGPLERFTPYDPNPGALVQLKLHVP